MVLLKTTIAGFAILIIGVLLLTMIGQYITVQVQDVHRHDVEPHAEFLVGDLVDQIIQSPGRIRSIRQRNGNPGSVKSDGRCTFHGVRFGQLSAVELRNTGKLRILCRETRTDQLHFHN